MFYYLGFAEKVFWYGIESASVESASVEKWELYRR